MSSPIVNTCSQLPPRTGFHVPVGGIYGLFFVWQAASEERLDVSGALRAMEWTRTPSHPSDSRGPTTMIPRMTGSNSWPLHRRASDKAEFTD